MPDLSFEDKLSALADALWKLSDSLDRLQVVLDPQAAIERRNKLATEALYAFALAVACGGLDTVPMEWRQIIAPPFEAWIAVANAVRDCELEPPE